MPQPKGASEHRDGRPSAQTKRKVSQLSLAESGIASDPRQKSISEIFSPTKQNSKSVNSNGIGSSPESKRLRHLSTSSTLTPPTQAIPPERMYSFTSSNAKLNPVIDLTGSPSSSPSKMSPSARKTLGVDRTSNFTPHTGAKRLVVKNLRKTPRVDPDIYLNQVWDQLYAALTAIFNGVKIPNSLEELYRGVENLCRQGKASELNRRLCERCKGYVSTELKAPLVVKAETEKEVDTLRAVLGAWTEWNTQLITIRSIFFYMDRSFLLHCSNSLSVQDMGLKQFRSHIFSDGLLKPKVLQGACDLIEFDRTSNYDLMDHSLFKQSIGMFHGLSVYTNDFEPKMLADSQSYYEKWAEEQAFPKDLAKYVEACQKLIDRESSRCDAFDLDHTTRRDLVTKLEEILVHQKASFLVEPDGVSKLLNSNEIEALEQLYSLLQRKRLGAKLKVPFEQYINTEGAAIVFDEKRENDMVVRLLEFKKKLDLIWKNSFHKHEVLGHTLREAFETFINKTKKTSGNWNTDNPKPGEMIAKYVDMLLKGGARAIPANLTSSISTIIGAEDEDADPANGDEDAEITKQLDQVLDLFRFVHGKAVFEAFYKKDLARRLLMGRSASSDAERSMLTRLKTECGAGFTHNLEQMFKDIDLARDEMSSYKTMLEEKRQKPNMDLSVNVLSASAWPTYPDVPVNVPQSILKGIDDFDQQYKVKHTGRRLSWKHALAHCILKATFPNGNKEIVVSSFQAIVMLLFNDVESGATISYAEIQAAIGLSDAELKRTLQSLACAKYRVLSKTPRGREVNDSDVFAVNQGFVDPKYRIKINQIQLKETREENKETHERVAADRHYETQAAIVRIMKSRKTIRHAELVAEVIKATKSRGVLDPADIKKNIEKLIEKDYMERDDGAYKYLA